MSEIAEAERRMLQQAPGPPVDSGPRKVFRRTSSGLYGAFLEGTVPRNAPTLSQSGKENLCSKYCVPYREMLLVLTWTAGPEECPGGVRGSSYGNRKDGISPGPAIEKVRSPGRSFLRTGCKFPRRSKDRPGNDWKAKEITRKSKRKETVEVLHV